MLDRQKINQADNWNLQNNLTLKATQKTVIRCARESRLIILGIKSKFHVNWTFWTYIFGSICKYKNKSTLYKMLDQKHIPQCQVLISNADISNVTVAALALCLRFVHTHNWTNHMMLTVRQLFFQLQIIKP